MENNGKAKQMIRESRFFHYEIADTLGINETAFSKWFRKEISDEQLQQIEGAISKLKGTVIDQLKNRAC